MHVGEWERADSLDVLSFYLPGFTVTFRRLIKFHIGFSLKEGDIEWRAPGLLPGEILYRCGDFDWVPLIGIWRAVG
ncbi:hypothetical protein Goshw_000976 [Gossypium schwendimanii]|uniref:Uncharacterized protein n=1 Tax=Gossypium schwendimanii TaxID=34291 RepID=A0A7J9N0S2_GOSSC|nr:hypothetical protein [Gossypium schwendimanii]